MAIRSFVMGSDGTLTVDVDTVIQPGALGVTSPTLTLVQAIDIIGYDKDIPNAPTRIKEYDSTSQALTDFGIVNKVNVLSVSPLIEATNKYPEAPAGSKLFSINYPLSFTDEMRTAIIAANQKTGYCVRIRTVMMDESIPSSPKLPTNITEFNQAVLSLGTPDSIKDFHNQYYSCVSIPVNIVEAAFLFPEPLYYYDWGSSNDYGIKVKGRSTKSILPPIVMKFLWDINYSPSMTISQTGENWEAYIDNFEDPYLYVGIGGIGEWTCPLDITYTDPSSDTSVTVNVNSEGRLPPPSRAINISDPNTLVEHTRDTSSPHWISYSDLPAAPYDFSTGKLTLENILKLNRPDEIALNGTDLRIWVKVHFRPHSDGAVYSLDTISNSGFNILPTLNVFEASTLWADPATNFPYNSVYTGGPDGWRILRTESIVGDLQAAVDTLRGSSDDTNTKFIMIVQTIIGRDNHNPQVPYPTYLGDYDNYFSSQIFNDYRNVSYFSIDVPILSAP